MAAVLSRQQLAEASGVSRRRIDELEAGQRLGVRPETAQRLARVLGCEPGDLIEVVD